MDKIHLARTKCDPNVLDDPDSTHLRPSGTMELSIYRGEYNIKTHGSVSCGPRIRRATPVSILTGRTKTSFSHLCISMITYLIGTKFATQLPASQGNLHSKFEGNRSSHFRDTSCQSFVFLSSFFFSSYSSSSSFRTLAKIAVTSKRVLRSP